MTGRCGALVLAALTVVACRRGSTDAAPSESSSAEPAVRAPAPPPVPATLGEALQVADARAEAVRGALAGFDTTLERYRPALELHYRGAVPFPLAFQVVSLGARGHAVLLQATQGESRALVWALGPAGEILWTKQQPLGGVKPGASEASLAAGPEGHVCLAWCNAETSSVALRRWAEDGGAFADYEAFHTDGCDALSVLYWPHHGWLIAAAHRGGAVLQRIREDGVHAFGFDGATLPWLASAPAPVSVGLDTEETFLLVRLGQSGGDGTPEYVFANRYDAGGKSMWPGPLSVKRLGAAPSTRRVALLPGREGGLRATLGVTGGDGVDVEVLSDGSVRRP